MAKEYDVVIIGGGPAGMSAAIYCTRANMSCCIIDKSMLGGRPLGYLEIENYLGLGKTSTIDMIEKFSEHVASFDIPVFEGEEIEEIDLENKIIKTNEHTFKSKAIIIATGSKPRLLNVDGEKEVTGRGVHYCAICDGHFYKDKVVAVIGGGNSACEEALFLSNIAKEVYIIQDLSSLTADKVTVEMIDKKENIKVFYNAQVKAIRGEDKVNCICLETHGDIQCCQYLNVDGVFPFIGFTANSEMFEVEKNRGFIITNEHMLTSMEGVFAVGDVRVKDYRQVVTAVADGAIGGIEASSYIRNLVKVEIIS